MNLEAMARLQPERVCVVRGNRSYCAWVRNAEITGGWRNWQPDLDTTEGGDDLLHLMLAVTAWMHKAPDAVLDRLSQHAESITDAVMAGDITALRKAVCDAAEAIGEVMKDGQH